ncbi:hypothetical protein EDC01DRAFT_130074 [Geopyxis carbonaria]|nr:hypothetical protein EDC01DRAFT_130074 [Geopyxis carbonaria]
MCSMIVTRIPDRQYNAEDTMSVHVELIDSVTIPRTPVPEACGSLTPNLEIGSHQARHTAYNMRTMQNIEKCCANTTSSLQQSAEKDNQIVCGDRIPTNKVSDLLQKKNIQKHSLSHYSDSAHTKKRQKNSRKQKTLSLMSAFQPAPWTIYNYLPTGNLQSNKIAKTTLPPSPINRHPPMPSEACLTALARVRMIKPNDWEFLLLPPFQTSTINPDFSTNTIGDVSQPCFPINIFGLEECSQYSSQEDGNIDQSTKWEHVSRQELDINWINDNYCDDSDVMIMDTNAVDFWMDRYTLEKGNYN